MKHALMRLLSGLKGLEPGDGKVPKLMGADPGGSGNRQHTKRVGALHGYFAIYLGWHALTLQVCALRWAKATSFGNLIRNEGLRSVTKKLSVVVIIFLVFRVFAPAQTNNIGIPIPASSFGFTVHDHALSPILPHAIVRSWDSNHVAWFSLNPSRGVYKWANLDAFMAGHAGKDMIYTFGLTPGWAASHPEAGTPYMYGSSCSMPANMSDWDTFVTAIATHAGERIKYWELWNEPMNYQYWCGKDFATTATMFQHAYKIIKRIIPDALILAPSTDKDFGLAWMKYYFAAGGSPFDVMTIHGYPEGKNVPESIVPMISKYAAFMAAHGMSGMPIWDTETNWGNSDAAWLAKMYLLSWSSGVARTIWYSYDNKGGLWDTKTGLTDTGTAYATLYAWLVGATMTSACAKDDAGTYTCPISRSKYKGLIVWNSTSTVSMAAPAGMTQFEDLQGGTHAVSKRQVSVGNSPILIETSSRKAH